MCLDVHFYIPMINRNAICEIRHIQGGINKTMGINIDLYRSHDMVKRQKAIVFAFFYTENAIM